MRVSHAHAPPAAHARAPRPAAPLAACAVACRVRRVYRAPLRGARAVPGDDSSAARSAPSASAAEGAAHSQPLTDAAGGQAGAEGTQPSGAQHSGGGGGSKQLHRLRSQLEELQTRYRALDHRLDSLESTLLTLLSNVKDKARQAAAGGAGTGSATVPPDEAAVEGALPATLGSSDVPEYEYDEAEEGEDGGGGMFDLRRLQSSLTENINKGYLESVKHLREIIMAHEWELNGKALAQRKGVARFEQHIVDKDMLGDSGLSFETLSALYDDPSRLDVLPNDTLKLLARSIIQQTVDERYMQLYMQATITAKELAHTGLKDVLPDSAGKVGGVLKDMLPLPGFLKK